MAERKRGRVWGVIVPHLSQKSEIFDSSYDSLRAAAKRRLLACTRLRAQSREEPLREGQEPPLQDCLMSGKGAGYFFSFIWACRCMDSTARLVAMF